MIGKHEIDNVIRGCDNCSLTSTVIKKICKVKCTFKITLNRTVAIIATHNQRDARRVMMISLKCLNDLEVIIQRSMRLNCIKRYM